MRVPGGRSRTVDTAPTPQSADPDRQSPDEADVLLIAPLRISARGDRLNREYFSRVRVKFLRIVILGYKFPTRGDS